MSGPSNDAPFTGILLKRWFFILISILISRGHRERSVVTLIVIGPFHGCGCARFSKASPPVINGCLLTLCKL